MKPAQARYYRQRSIPRTGLIGLWLAKDGMVDSVGLLTDTEQIRSDLISIFFDGETRRDDEDIIPLIESSDLTNNGWELVGNSSKGYAVYENETAVTVLKKAYRYFRENYLPAVIVRYLNTSHYTNVENYI